MNNSVNHWQVSPRLRRRNLINSLFRACGIAALTIGALFLCCLLAVVVPQGLKAFSITELKVSVHLDPELIVPSGNTTTQSITRGDFYSVVKESLYSAFPEVTDRNARKELRQFLSPHAENIIRDRLLEQPKLLGSTTTFSLPLRSNLDQLHKGNIDESLPAQQRGVSDAQLDFYRQKLAAGKINSNFNWFFLLHGDSRNPEVAGIGGALLGSFFSLLICALVGIPLGICAALYLEEFAPRSSFTYLINVNISNLAAVPSIIFGLLGLAVFLNTLGVPRGTPLAGGLVLSLMILPTVIIAARSAIAAVAPSIKDGALALGASHTQVVFHHVLPAALPGIMTGTIVGLSRALGETAPLLMIGMVAFVVDIPTSPLSSSAALPVQIYLWAESAERGFMEKSSAAIIVIMVFLICMNALAVLLRNRFEKRW